MHVETFPWLNLALLDCNQYERYFPPTGRPIRPRPFYLSCLLACLPPSFVPSVHPFIISLLASLLACLRGTRPSNPRTRFPDFPVPPFPRSPGFFPSPVLSIVSPFIRIFPPEPTFFSFQAFFPVWRNGVAFGLEGRKRVREKV